MFNFSTNYLRNTIAYKSIVQGVEFHNCICTVPIHPMRGKKDNMSQRYHEGVDTYYENLYKNTDYGSILRAAEYWERTGHKELAERLKAPAYEGAENNSCPPRWPMKGSLPLNIIRKNSTG